MSAYVSTALRQLVVERCVGRCKYCLISNDVVLVPHEVDHIIALKHGGLTEPDNLALSCTLCNKHKGSDLASLDPDTGSVVALFHPRHDKWTEHFETDDGQIIPLTAAGRVTVKLLQLNAPERVEERRLLILSGAWAVSAID
jgi:hypothetical protein